MEGVGRVLCVDDEPHVLEGLERVLFDEFEVMVAGSGKKGLEMLEQEGPVAVVVSDMRMPEMDGAAFLAAVRNVAPDTVRILLTGQTDIQSAVAAVNHGSIFRFLCKPCPDDVLIDALAAGNKQYRLSLVEKDLLESTLKGSVQLLTDVLSLAAPEVFSRASVIRNYVAQMARHKDEENLWEYELAAMLCHLGCITVPPEVLKRMYAGQPLSEVEREMVDNHSQTAYAMLAKISRFDRIAEIVRLQGETKIASTVEKPVRIGVQMIQIAEEIQRRIAKGGKFEEVVKKLSAYTKYDSSLLDTLKGFRADSASDAVRAVSIDELQTTMVVDEDIRSKTGVVVANKGREVDEMLITRLKNFASGIGVVEPIRVRISLLFEDAPAMNIILEG